MDDKTQSMALKIKALLAKTINNGATEAEAMMAMTKARELMDRHSISMSELDIKAEGFDGWTFTEAGADARFIITRLWSGLEAITETTFYSKSVKRGVRKPHFFGLKSDVIFAQWLTDVMIDLITRETKAYLKALPKGAATRRHKVSFMYGISCRISERMVMEAAARRASRLTATGTNLALIDKRALVLRELRAIGIILQSSSTHGVRLNGEAAGAGRSAGDNATWSKPVNSGGGVRSIGSK